MEFNSFGTHNRRQTESNATRVGKLLGSFCPLNSSALWREFPVVFSSDYKEAMIVTRLGAMAIVRSSSDFGRGKLINLSDFGILGISFIAYSIYSEY